MKTVKYFGLVCNPVEFKQQALKFILPDDIEPLNITPYTVLKGLSIYGLWLEPNYFGGFTELEKEAINSIYQLKDLSTS